MRKKLKQKQFIKRKIPVMINAILRGIAYSTLSVSVASQAFAEESTKVNEDENLEVIEVTGVWSSLEKSLSVKQDSTGFVDAISAAGVGKLPDSNVAEALQRVTGVAIQRSRGEGDFVSIRGLGPEFVRGTINGRSIVSGTETFDSTLSGGTASSTGRATNFDILPSEIISTLEVVKSASAKHVEGGIGGIVDVKTARPLEIGNKAVVSLAANHRDFSEKTDPNGAALLSWANDKEDFGLLGSVSYSKRSIREDFSRSFGWLPWGTYDTDSNGLSDRKDIIVPLSNNLDSYKEERERLTFNGTAQWVIDDSSELTFDIIYSKKDTEHDEQSAILVSLPNGYPQNPDNSFDVPASEFVGNTLPHIISNLPPEVVSDSQVAKDDLLSLGLNYRKEIGAWTLSSDFSYSDAGGELAFDRAVIVGDGKGDNGKYLFDYVASNNGIAVDYKGDASLSNPANYFIRNGRVTRTKNDDSELAFSFDVSREIDSDFVSSIEMGARYRTREKEVNRRDFDGSLGANLRLSDVPGANTFTRGHDNFLNGGKSGDFNYSDILFADVDSTLKYAASKGTDISPKFDPLGSYNIEEDTIAAYVQLNLDGEIGNVPFIGDFGFRVVHTQQDISGFTRPFSIDGTQTPGKLIFTSETNEAISFDDSYVNVLPSLNLRFELDDDLFLRVAASKSLTRPTFQALSPSLKINPSATIDQNNDGIAATANSGNSSLKPYESTNFDLGVEWYFGKASAIYGSVYYKEIEDFIATVTNQNVTIGSVVFDSVSQPDNQGVAQLVGLELGYQQSFESGFGYLVNASFTDNSAEFTDGGDIPFPGVSELSYNLAGYYENGPLNARIAYSYRSDFLLLASDVFTNQVFVEDYAQLDASASYDVSDSMTIFFQAVNLTDENTEAFTSNKSKSLSRQFLSEGHVGRTFTLGVRASF